MKKYFSNKKNRRQLIIAGIIAVFTALIPTIANIPVTYAEETSPDGKYKLVAQYSLVEELSCSLSIAGGGDQNGTLFLKSSDGKVLSKTSIVMQEFQPEVVKWHPDHVEMNHIKWRYDGKSSPALDPALFFQKVRLAETAQGLADVAENKTLNLFTTNAIQGKNEFEKFKKIFELLQEMQVLIDKGITPPPALFAVPPDKKLGTAPDYRQIMNDLWNLQADNYRIFADFMEKKSHQAFAVPRISGQVFICP